MKKHFYPFILLVIAALTSAGNAGFAQTMHQTTTRPLFTHSIGAQFNPYLGQSLFTGGSERNYVFALRYGYESRKGISFGPEFSGHFGHSLSAKWQNYNFGMFIRYTFLRQKKVSPFVELSGYYQTSTMTSTDPRFDFDGQKTIKHQRFSYYVAPGISFYIYKKKLSLDLFVKFSSDKFLNGQYVIPSFRLVYHF